MTFQLRRILQFKNVVIVGVSKDPAKDSHIVALYLKDQRYNVTPVNPTTDSIAGMKCYPSISHLPDELKSSVDVVDVFRRPEDVPPIAEEAIRLRADYSTPKVFWMQLGIRNEDAAKKLRSNGIEVVQDQCMMASHKLLRARGIL